MSSNITTTSCTNHVYIRYNYMNEHVEDGAFKTIFVKLTENDSDILTKNLSADLHEKFSKKIGR